MLLYTPKPNGFQDTVAWMTSRLGGSLKFRSLIVPPRTAWLVVSTGWVMMSLDPAPVPPVVPVLPVDPVAAPVVLEPVAAPVLPESSSSPPQAARKAAAAADAPVAMSALRLLI